MSFLQLLLLLRKLPFRDLLDYPDDLRDEQGVRRWLVAVSKAGVVLSDLTDTTIDDAVVDGFKEVVENEEAFATIYGLILNIFAHEDDGYVDDYFVAYEDTQETATLTGFSPTLIIAIVQLVVMLLKFIRDRRN